MSGPNERFGILAAGIQRDMSEKGWAPARFWVLWSFLFLLGIIAFYVVLTPVWLGLRAAAWIAEFRARRQS